MQNKNIKRTGQTMREKKSGVVAYSDQIFLVQTSPNFSVWGPHCIYYKQLWAEKIIFINELIQLYNLSEWKNTLQEITSHLSLHQMRSPPLHHHIRFPFHVRSPQSHQTICPLFLIIGALHITSPPHHIRCPLFHIWVPSSHQRPSVTSVFPF